jgi:uncharacterized protein YjiS (DUF1127 family)
MNIFLSDVADIIGTVRSDRRRLPIGATDPAGGPLGVRGLIEVWGARVRSRRQLADMARDMPELIVDIGLTMEQVEAEIDKPFWRR